MSWCDFDQTCCIFCSKKITSVFLTFDLQIIAIRWILTNDQLPQIRYIQLHGTGLFHHSEGVLVKIDLVAKMNHLATGGDSQKWSDMTSSKKINLRVT